MNANLTYLKDKNNITEHKNVDCTIINLKTNDAYIYYNCTISIDNTNNITDISFWKEIVDDNGKMVQDYIYLEPYFNITKCTKELYIFNLTQEIEEKPGEFILRGKMHKNLTDTNEFKIEYYAYYSQTEYEIMRSILICQQKSGLFYECKLLPTSDIAYLSIDKIIAESSKSKIIIYAPLFSDTSIIFSKDQETSSFKDTNATIISVGNFKQSDKSEDATGKIYLKCTNYALINLKNYIRFYVDINYSYNETKTSKKRNKLKLLVL